MKQHGALFTSENRLAIREGRKTQTRRIPASFKEINEHPDGWEFIGFEDELASFRLKGDESIFLVKLPWAIGDELYIKERVCTVCHDRDRIEDACYFNEKHEAFGGCDSVKWNTSMFMPKWAARDWLRVLAVRCERLQSISGQDIKAEGLDVQFTMVGSFDALERFAQLWDSINKKHPWERNEWVVAYTFERKI
jgi:hypothetical protein